LLLFVKDQTPLQILSQEIIMALSYEDFAVLVHGPFSNVFGMCSMHVLLKVQLGAFSKPF